MRTYTCTQPEVWLVQNSGVTGPQRWGVRRTIPLGGANLIQGCSDHIPASDDEIKSPECAHRKLLQSPRLAGGNVRSRSARKSVAALGIKFHSPPQAHSTARLATHRDYPDVHITKDESRHASARGPDLGEMTRHAALTFLHADQDPEMLGTRMPLRGNQGPCFNEA